MFAMVGPIGWQKQPHWVSCLYFPFNSPTTCWNSLPQYTPGIIFLYICGSSRLKSDIIMQLVNCICCTLTFIVQDGAIPLLPLPFLPLALLPLPSSLSPSFLSPSSLSPSSLAPSSVSPSLLSFSSLSPVPLVILPKWPLQEGCKATIQLKEMTEEGITDLEDTTYHLG